MNSNIKDFLIIQTASCPYGERFETCGTACPVTCQNRNDPPTPCTTDCVEGCFCIKGFIRDTQSGQCIPEEDCPGKQIESRSSVSLMSGIIWDYD